MNSFWPVWLLEHPIRRLLLQEGRTWCKGGGDASPQALRGCPGLQGQTVANTKCRHKQDNYYLGVWMVILKPGTNPSVFQTASENEAEKDLLPVCTYLFLH